MNKYITCNAFTVYFDIILIVNYYCIKNAIYLTTEARHEL